MKMYQKRKKPHCGRPLLAVFVFVRVVLVTHLAHADPVWEVVSSSGLADGRDIYFDRVITTSGGGIFLTLANWPPSLSETHCPHGPRTVSINSGDRNWDRNMLATALTARSTNRRVRIIFRYAPATSSEFCKVSNIEY